MVSKILQYVIVRKDILPTKKSSQAFTMGACMAQACHAVTAAIVRNLSARETQQYIEGLEDMTVCVLGVDTADELLSVSSQLAEHRIPYHLWIEKPEKIPTALATAPMEKDTVAPLVAHLKLLR